MKRKLFVLLAIAGICFGIMSCSNPSSSDDYTTYKVEVGVISQSTYNTALSKISYWGEVSYSNIASLRLYLYNNTISDHEVQTNVSLSEIKDFLLSKGMSNYEVESEINVLKVSFKHLLKTPFFPDVGSIYDIIAIGDKTSSAKNLIER